MQRIKDMCDFKDSSAPCVRDALIMHVTNGKPMSKRELNAALGGFHHRHTIHHNTIAPHHRHMPPSSSGLFGESYTDKLKSQMFLAYHKVSGKSTNGRRRRRAIQIVLRALTGETHQIAVPRQATVGDMQEVVCLLFGQPYPATKVKFVTNQVAFDEFADLPFKSAEPCGEVRVIFSGKVNVTIKGLNGDTHEIAVDPDTSLRNMQLLGCKLFRQRFPATMATLVIGERLYDEFIEVPFQGCTGPLDANVVFSPTTDPHAWYLVACC